MVGMSETEDSRRPETTRIYKGPRWLVDRLPRFGSSDGDDAPEET